MKRGHQVNIGLPNQQLNYDHKLFVLVTTCSDKVGDHFYLFLCPRIVRSPPVVFNRKISSVRKNVWLQHVPEVDQMRPPN